MGKIVSFYCPFCDTVDSLPRICKNHGVRLVKIDLTEIAEKYSRLTPWELREALLRVRKTLRAGRGLTPDEFKKLTGTPLCILKLTEAVIEYCLAGKRFFS